MRKFKKAAALILASAMMLSMAACGENNETTVTTEDTATVTDASVEDTEEVTEEVTEEEEMQLENGMVLIDLNFDDGELQDVTKYSNGGVFDLSVEDGEMVVGITSCGNLDYANQAYYDGFELVKGCVYTFTFDVRSDIDRKLEWRLQINGGDYHAYVGEYIDVTTETQTISVDFEMEEDTDPAPRLCFNMGKMEDMDADPGQHNIYFDNIQLVVKDVSNAEIAEEVAEAPLVSVSQIGYLPDDVKTVIVGSDVDETFEVVNIETGETVYEGTYGRAFYDDPNKRKTRHGDFSEVTEPGTYKIVSSDSGETYEFTIGEGIYDDMYKDVILMLYNQRCGVELDSDISGDFAHVACHTGDAVVYGTNETKDVSGGWHDAGDYGRYVVPGAKTVQDLLIAYEDYNQTADDIGIPESGNGVPDLLDEARYELEWMLKMQDTSGGVYHKVTCLVFPETVMPEEENDQLYLAPISTTATADFAAVMAKASLLYAEYDADFAAECLEAAEAAWAYIEDGHDNDRYKNPDDIVTGEYPDNYTSDELLWAACELYIATGKAEYKNAISEYSSARTGLGWADVGTYGMYDLIKADVTGVDSEIEYFKTKIKEEADYIVARGSDDGYFMSLLTTYPWGSNMTVANNGMTLLMQYKISGDASYMEFAKKQLDYLLGANAVGYCFVTGYGTVSPQSTHHRPSMVLEQSMPGMLVGGPDSNLEDPYSKAVLYDAPAAQRYVDNAQSFSCNEITIYWNSPLIYILTGLK